MFDSNVTHSMSILSRTHSHKQSRCCVHTHTHTRKLKCMHSGFSHFSSSLWFQKAAGLELAHLNALFALQNDSHAHKAHFSFPLMCLIDYRGHRLVACSVLPIDEDTIVYGSNDQGYSGNATLCVVCTVAMAMWLLLQSLWRVLMKTQLCMSNYEHKIEPPLKGVDV